MKRLCPTCRGKGQARKTVREVLESPRWTVERDEAGLPVRMHFVSRKDRERLIGERPSRKLTTCWTCGGCGTVEGDEDARRSER